MSITTLADFVRRDGVEQQHQPDDREPCETAPERRRSVAATSRQPAIHAS